MFDPHGIRRYNRRTTRKGQIIQARAVEAPFVINPLHVDAYKEFIIKNHLIDTPTPPEPSPQPTIGFIDTWYQIEEPHEYQLQPDEITTFATPQSPFVSIMTIHNTSSIPITVSYAGYYCETDFVRINLDNDPASEVKVQILTETDTDISLISIVNPYMIVPLEWIAEKLE